MTTPRKKKIDDCHGCGYTTRVEYFPPRSSAIEEKWLCRLCAATFSGNAVDYPTHYDAPTLATICYVGNAILDAVKRQTRPSDP